MLFIIRCTVTIS
uniref:Uncharacterized protein n=1 Tax=Arundo donax TaxID=35708 RepID=A0A0A9HS09_ARUDO